MARSFDIAYRYLARDSFSGVNKKIRAGAIATRIQFRRLRKTVRKTARSFKRDSSTFASSFKRMAVAALAFFSIKGFFTAGAKFQDAMADLSAITGAVGKDLSNLRKETLLMAKASVTSQAEVAEAIKLVASAKPDLLSNLDALTATTKQVLLLKNAAGIELADAANITAQGLNIFGKSADQAGKFVNILAAGAKLGSSEIRDTGEAMLIAGPGARAAGLSFLQLNAAIQTVAKGGIKASRAGTALNAIFGRLQRAGIDFQELGLQGSFEIIKKKMDSLADSTARAKFAAKIFGEEHSKVGFAILNNVNFLGQYERTLKGTNVAQEQASIRLNTFNSRFKKLGIIINDKIIRMFVRLEPMITKQVTAFAAFIDTIDPKQVEAFADSLGILFRATVVIGKAFGFVLSILKQIGTVLGEVTAAIATLDFGSFSQTTKDAFKFISPGTAIVEGISTLFGGPENEIASTGPPIAAGGDVSRTDINVNMNAPEGIIQSVQSRSTGGRNTNVGVNMAGG